MSRSYRQSSPTLYGLNPTHLVLAAIFAFMAATLFFASALAQARSEQAAQDATANNYVAPSDEPPVIDAHIVNDSKGL